MAYAWSKLESEQPLAFAKARRSDSKVSFEPPTIWGGGATHVPHIFLNAIDFTGFCIPIFFPFKY